MADQLAVTGMDLSLTSTGMARITAAGHVGCWTLRPPKQLDGHQRLDWLLRRILDTRFGAYSAPHVVAIEGPSYGSGTGQQHERAGLWWMVAHTLWQRGVPYVVISPNTRAKYATGTGSGPNSGKDKVLAAVIRRYASVPVDGNDQADALILAAMTADHYGQPIASVPETHRAALRGVKGWPVL